MKIKLLPLPILPSLMAIPSIIVLLWLGVWQVDRLSFKQTMMQRLEERVGLPPVALPNLEVLDQVDWEFHPVTLSGVFHHDQEIHVLQRSLSGEEGLHIYTPFEMKDTNKFILIDRGFVTFEVKEAENRPASLVEGMIEINGILRFDNGMPSLRKMVLPDADLNKNLWYGLDINTINQRLGLSLPFVYIVDSNENKDIGYPKGKQWRLAIRNDHLEYAITWLILSVALSVIFVIYVKNWRAKLDLKL